MTDSTPSMDSVSIPLTQGYSTIVSVEDVDLLNYAWCLGKANYAVRSIKIGGKGTSLRLHRVILERMLGRSLEKSEMVDHRDGDVLNNRRSNLRLATQAQNMQNRRMNNNCKSGYKGVSHYKRNNTWRASIHSNKQSKTIGYFATPEDAARAYDIEAINLFGEFARLNNVPGYEDSIPQPVNLPIGRPKGRKNGNAL